MYKSKIRKKYIYINIEDEQVIFIESNITQFKYEASSGCIYYRPDKVR